MKTFRERITDRAVVFLPADLFVLRTRKSDEVVAGDAALLGAELRQLLGVRIAVVKTTIVAAVSESSAQISLLNQVKNSSATRSLFMLEIEL
ncbi:MAG: hypothetical protein H0X73_01585 [Chthoniobacterales bacterium]|nr:hypothetical protein [Chthoniobacterales bacterium]